MSQGSRYPPRGGDTRREYDSYAGHRENNRDRDRNHNARDRHNDRDDFRRSSPPRGPSGGDSYRPVAYSHRDNLYNSQDSRRQSSSRYDSWAPGTNGYHPPPPNYSQPLPPPSLPNDGFRPPQGDFSFRVEKPAAVQESYDTYRPNAGSGQQYRQNGLSHLPHQSSYRQEPSARRGRGRDARGGRGGGYTFTRFKAADRPMLGPLHSTGPEQTFYDPEAGATYRSLNELSDSDEAEMDISDSEGNASAPQEPSGKRARLSAHQSASDDVVPKWSNPDPYTALPPPDAAGRARKDVVQLIRKARVDSKESKSSIPAEAEEFISCVDDSDAESEVQVLDVRPALKNNGSRVPGAPTGPRSAQPSRQTLEPSKASSSELNESSKHGPAGSMPLPTQPAKQRAGLRQTVLNFQPTTDRSTNTALGTRKRTHDDEIKLPAHARLRKATKMPVGGSLAWDWKPTDGEDPRPWLVNDHSGSSNIGTWLHKEIEDFYDHVRPKDFEERIRQQVVQDLKNLCRSTYGDAEVYPFGSFPSGLYLPTGDIDLVFCSDSVRNGGRAKYDTKSVLFRFRALLTRTGFSLSNDIEVIVKAKVPLVKFIESRTGLKVDVSFENTTGVRAIETFLNWKKKYPVMPALVTLIKHFLAMRGLNEPVNGGIGGFSVICLVVSMLQMNPELQSRAMSPGHHLGDLLMEFLNLYGNRFDYHKNAISLNPPAYIAKSQVAGFTYRNPDRLSIIDPNDSSNDISGGSSNTGTITSLFAEAYRDLRERMSVLSQADKAEKQGASILEVIFAGNYSSFRLQRAHLEKLAEQGLRPPQPPPMAVKRSPW